MPLAALTLCRNSRATFRSMAVTDSTPSLHNSLLRVPDSQEQAGAAMVIAGAWEWRGRGRGGWGRGLWDTGGASGANGLRW